ncbi:aryl-sulfate sulfotransferase [Bifidobacterium crudilactis]|jgi:arylsulfate sulfotransferase|uniref:aryl-sulfate sulfotransferase n=1 Tax=Bifidobacterium crudilactis TaxID=327277 RepID=UPI002F35D203
MPKKTDRHSTEDRNGVTEHVTADSSEHDAPPVDNPAKTNQTTNEADEASPWFRILRGRAGRLSLAVLTLLIVTGVVIASQDRFAAAIESARQNRLTAQIEQVYTTGYQTQAAENLQKERDKNTHDEDNIFVKNNPYGTNTTGLYVYFTTTDAVKLSYTVSAQGTDYADFTATPDKGDEYTTTHEFQALGLIPGVTNTITFTMTAKNGKQTTRSIEHKGAKLLSDVEVQLASTKNNTSQNLGNGLYAILGNDSDDQDFMYYYDVHGVIRGEIPILFYRSHRLLFRDNIMYFSVSTRDIVGMNSLGRIVKWYNTGSNYILHHDYGMDEDGNLIVLATDIRKDTIQDAIIGIDADSGKVSTLVDMSKLYASYEQTTEVASMGSSSKTTDSTSSSFDPDTSDVKKDWLHLNTIQILDDGSAILSSRETSTIIKLNDIESNPSIDYMIGEKNFWKDTDFAKYLLTQGGSFPNTGGQHTVTYEADSSLPSGQYYLYMFDNNYGVSNTRPDYDWAANTDGVNTTYASSGNSRYQRYLVDENTKSYKLVSSFNVPYSPIVSSAQELSNGTILMDSGVPGVFGVYDGDGTLISQWKMTLRKNIIYRVYQYDFHNFYFA